MSSNFEYAHAIEMYGQLAKRDKCEIHNVVMDVEADMDQEAKVQYSSYCFICMCVETLKAHLENLRKISHDEDQIDTIRIMRMVNNDWLGTWKQENEVL